VGLVRPEIVDSVLAPPGFTRSQAVRRERVIQAAIELAREGGYDAVQMRDVSHRARVALGTIYNYFSSKDHLLAAAFTEWAEDVERRIFQRPLRGETSADRVAEVLRRAVRQLVREPQLSAALVTALSSSDAGVSDCQLEIANVLARLVTTAIDDDEGIGEDRAAGIIRTIGQVWFTALLGWVNGWPSAGDMGAELEETARLLLEH
jgi:AcrR family transcriptional regulator